jgi:hypothetical protein
MFSTTVALPITGNLRSIVEINIKYGEITTCSYPSGQ